MVLNGHGSVLRPGLRVLNFLQFLLFFVVGILVVFCTENLSVYFDCNLFHLLQEFVLVESSLD